MHSLNSSLKNSKPHLVTINFSLTDCYFGL